MGSTWATGVSSSAVACQVPVSAPAVLEHPPLAFFSDSWLSGLLKGSYLCQCMGQEGTNMGQEVEAISPIPLCKQPQLSLNLSFSIPLSKVDVGLVDGRDSVFQPDLM